MSLNFQNLTFISVIHISPRQRAVEQNYLLSSLLVVYVFRWKHTNSSNSSIWSYVIYCILLFLKIYSYSDSNKSISLCFHHKNVDLAKAIKFMKNIYVKDHFAYTFLITKQFHHWINTNSLYFSLKNQFSFTRQISK